ncbi:PC4/YdbC family ssDNA-binding protein [Nostoc sp. NIES-2111]
MGLLKRPVVMARVVKFDGNEILIRLILLDSKEWIVDIREYQRISEELKPTKKGIALGIGRASQIANAIQEAVELAKGSRRPP